MADNVSEYTFKISDVMIALVKHQKIKDGCWQLVAQFGFGAANIGPNSDTLNPSAIAQLTGLGLRKVDAQGDNLTVDAAKINETEKGER